MSGLRRRSRNSNKSWPRGQSEMAEDVECQYCGGEFRGGKGLRTHQRSAHKEEVITTVVCNWCGKGEEVVEWKSDGRHYCSRICANAWNAYIRQGERHHNYKGGTTRSRDYQFLAKAIRKRDCECLRCGDANGAADGRALHVHHIIPEDVAEVPHRADNLIALCGGCHRRLEGESIERHMSECGLDSLSDLSLGEKVEGSLDGLKDIPTPVERAPDPRPGMFVEAQRLASGDN